MSFPMPYPMAAPSAICRMNMGMRSRGEPEDPVINEMSPSVRKTAIGSLLPDSNSSNGFKGSRRLTDLDRMTANTAAASVEDTIAPIRSPSVHDMPNATVTNHPTSPAVIATPSVESATPWPSTGRTLDHRVSNPPANKMNVSATTPRN
jgi:hypothetical protein